MDHLMEIETVELPPNGNYPRIDPRAIESIEYEGMGGEAPGGFDITRITMRSGRSFLVRFSARHWMERAERHARHLGGRD